MPRIQQYQASAPTAGPVLDRTGVRSVTPTGGGLQALGDATEKIAAVFQRRNEQAEVSDISAQMAGAHADLTNQLAETMRTAQPGDPDVAQNFMKDKVDSAIQKIGDNVSTPEGRNHFNTLAATLKGHFLQSAVAEQVDAAGVKAVADHTNSLNSLSSSLIANPSAFDTTLKLNKDGLDGLVKTGLLPSKHALQLQETDQTELAKSAVLGWYKSNPQVGIDKLNAGAYDQYIKGDLKSHLLGAGRVEIDRRAKAADDARTEAARQAGNAFVARLQPDSKNPLTVPDVLANNNMDFREKEHFISQIGKSQDDAAADESSSAFIDVLKRIHAEDTDPRKMRDEKALFEYFDVFDMKQIGLLRKEIADKRSPDGENESKLKAGLLKVAEEKLLNPVLGLRDPEGHEQLQKYESWMLPEYTKQRQAGKSAVQLLDPGSPDYLGKTLSNYTKTPQQVMQTITRQMGGSGKAPLPPERVRKAGENPANYLERINKLAGTTAPAGSAVTVPASGTPVSAFEQEQASLPKSPAEEAALEAIAMKDKVARPHLNDHKKGDY